MDHPSMPSSERATPSDFNTSMVSKTLRVANSTLRVMLTKNPEEDLYLDRNIVKERCAHLAMSLRDSSDAGYTPFWDRSEIIKGEDGEDKRMYTLALNFADDTFLLEGSTFTTAVGDCDEARDFHQSELAQPEWSHIWPDPVSCYEGVRHNAAEMHVVMFKVLHDPRSAVKDIEEMALNEIVCLCALSEYYGCFVHISSKVSYAISMSSSFDQDIEDMPTAFLRLAVKLEDESLYVKAYRLIVARSLRDKRTVHSWVYSDTRLLANHLGLSQEQYVDKYSKIIMTPLRKLQLRKAVSQHKDEDHTVRTSWVSMLKKAWSGRAADEKSFETSSFLARSLFSEWLTAEDFSEDIRLEEMDFPRQCSTEPGWPNFIIAKIEKFSQAEYPGELIGKGVVAEAVAAFGGGWASNAVEQVYAGVGRLVLEANWEIQKALALQPDFSTNKILTPCRCIQAINGDDTYSHLGGPEFDLPWEWENREDFWDRVL